MQGCISAKRIARGCVYAIMKISTSLLVALLFLIQESVFAQTKLPDTPAASQLSAWLAAFNSGDRATLLQFLEKNEPERVSHVDETMNFRAQTGGFDIKEVKECAELSCVVLVQERSSDQMGQITIDVDPTPAHVIKQIQLRATRGPMNAAVARMTEAEAVSALKTRLDKETSEGKFSGAAMIAKNGVPVFSGAYGLANREKKIANQLDTRFRIGSMNKMFTATAIVQLAQAAKLHLSDPLIKYLPDYPNKDFASKVTLQQLLTHTGGAGDIFGPEFEQHRTELRTLQDYIKLYRSRDATFEPGSRWDYSNYGFILLGRVVEKVSGQDYYQYVREHIFKPAGMNSTDSLPEDQPVANRSVGYMSPGDPKDSRPNDDTLPYRGTSAGGGYSTVGDFLAFANALVGHKLLNAENTELLTTGKVDTPRGDKYAFGFSDEVMPDGVRCFGHGGGAPGMNGELKMCMPSGYVIIVLANVDPPAATRMADFAASRLPGR
jgi:D-alanyl-D-alanine carboxypeptidase